MTWGEFEELPTEGLNYLLDITALNERYENSKDNPYRWQVGSFRVPKWITREERKRICKVAIDKWIGAIEERGWQLKSKVQVYNGQPFGYDIMTGVTMLDQEELRVRAIFKNILSPKSIKIEIPLPDDKTSLEDAMNAYGVKSRTPS